MLELEHGFRVVDMHARLDPERDATATRGRAIDPGELEREMHQAGIVRSVVFPGRRSEGYLQANNGVARRSVDRPFIAFARLDGPRDPGDTPVARLRNLAASRAEHHAGPEDVERYAYNDRFFGFKLSPAADGLPDEDVLDVLEEAGLPVLVHVGEGFPPEAVAATLLQRSLPVVMEHFGGYPLDRERMDAAIGLLSEHDRCYLDTSVVRYRDRLERAMLEHPDRVLFGSGAPNIHPTVGVTELLTLDVPEDVMRRAFWKNADRAFGDELDLTRWR